MPQKGLLWVRLFHNDEGEAVKGSLKMPLGQYEEFLEPAAVQHNCLEIVLHNVLGLGVRCYLREAATFCPRITAGLVDKQCTSSSRRHGSISCLQIGREECLGSWLFSAVMANKHKKGFSLALFTLSPHPGPGKEGFGRGFD